MEKNPGKLIKKTIKVLAYILVSVLVLLMLVIVLIRIPKIQNKITQKAITFLESKIGTPVSLKYLYIDFPKTIVIEGFLIKDKSEDTLLYVGKLSVDTNLWGLTRNEINLNEVDLEKTRINVYTKKNDAIFNYQFIIAAFSTPEESVDTTATAWAFAIDKISLSNIDASYQDAYSGNRIKTHIGDFKVSLQGSDFLNSVFKISNLELKNTKANINLSPPNKNLSSNKNTTQSDSNKLQLDFNELHLQNVFVDYENTLDAQALSTRITDLLVEANKIDFQNQLIDLRKISLQQSFISYRDSQVETPQIDLDSLTKQPFAWNIQVKDFSIVNSSLHVENNTAKRKTKSFDATHLWIMSLQTSIKDIVVSEENYAANIQHLSFKEKNGFELKQLSGAANLSNKEFGLTNFVLKTTQSTIQLDGSATFPSLETALANYQNVALNATMKDSFIASQDVLYFIPSLLDSLPIKLPKQTKLFINSSVAGKVNDLTIKNIALRILDSTSLVLRGKIKGLPDVEKMMMDLELSQFHTAKKDLERVMIDSLPKGIKLPDWIVVKGSYLGNLKKAQSAIQLSSHVGDIDATVDFDFNSKQEYDLTVNTNSLNIGYVLDQKEIGPIDMEVAIKGEGLSFDSINTSIDAIIKKIEYQKYSYSDFNVNVHVNNYLVTGSVSLDDKNLDFDLKGELNFQDSIPDYVLNLDLKNIDMLALHLSDRPIRARATLDANLISIDFKRINGEFSIRKVAIYNGEKLYKIDSLLFASLDQEGKSTLSIRSDILTGEFNGSFNIFELPQTIKQHIHQYFSIQDSTLTSFKTPQSFDFNLTLNNTEIFTEIFFPQLKSFVPGNIKGSFNSEKKLLAIDVDLTKIKYSTTQLDSFAVVINSNPKELTYKVRFKNLVVDTFKISALQLSGVLADNIHETSFTILDSLAEKKYVVAATVESNDNGYKFRFDPKQLMLNYQSWNLPNDNYLLFSKESIKANNFTLTRQNEKLSISGGKNSDALVVGFTNFELKNITNLISGTLPASGLLNGELQFAGTDQGEFSSALVINNLNVLEKNWGDANINLAYKNQIYSADLKFSGAQSAIQAKGQYKVAANSSYNATVDFNPLDLVVIEPFTFGQIKKMEGLMKGNVTIESTDTQPSIRGSVTFSNTRFISTYVNNWYKLNNETIAIEGNAIKFNNFTIRDERDNRAIIKGSLDVKNFSEVGLNLQLTCTNFQLFNTTAEENDLYYGLVRADIQAKIIGTSSEPKIETTIGLREESTFTYVVPESTKTIMERKGVIKFVDRDVHKDPFLAGLQDLDTMRTKFRGIQLSANLEFDDKSVLNIVIDPRSGDKLSVQGSSTLVVDMNSSGQLDLSGRYEISKGTYNFSFQNLAKREFNIEKGSSIVWSGDPLNAVMDIRAKYEVETSPLDLIYNQVNIANKTESNSYNQRLPFWVYLYVQGRILEPDIHFKLDMPESKRTALQGAVYAKLQDINTRESDLNKQVFALLILKRFISDNPFESQSGSTFNNTTRQSVSRLLSDQLNRLSENIKGVELNFDIKSYESNTGEEIKGKTKAQLGVTKDLFNDRLVVKLSGNVDLEGGDGGQKEVTDFIGDIALEYKISNDGRFRITGFQNSNFDMIDGELTETGVGLIYIKDYNTLRELFKANQKKR